MPYLYVVAAMLLRLMPHPWNLTPMGAMFLFGGSAFARKRESLLVPLGALMISDLYVIHVRHAGQYDWFSPFTWAGFLLVGLIGWTLRERRTAGRVAAASVAGSVLFFLITNFGVWLQWGMYPLTPAGLAECYAAAIPFFRNTLLGDLAYTALMFGSYNWLQQRHWLPARQS